MTPRMGLGIALLVAGLCGHLLAAHAIGGHYIAYRDHVFGFALLTIVPGLIAAGLGRRFRRGKHDISVLIVGGVNAILGSLVYINRFNVS